LRGGQLLSKIHPGDLLLAVDHVPCKGYSISDVKRLIAGPEGSQVRRLPHGLARNAVAARFAASRNGDETCAEMSAPAG